MIGGRDVEEPALKLHFLLGALVELEAVLAAKIEVRFTPDVAALGCARPELLEMKELADEPTCTLAEALLQDLSYGFSSVPSGARRRSPGAYGLGAFRRRYLDWILESTRVADFIS